MKNKSEALYLKGGLANLFFLYLIDLTDSRYLALFFPFPFPFSWLFWGCNLQ